MMLDSNFRSQRYEDADSEWVSGFGLGRVKCLIVCRGPVRKEAMEIFERMGVECGMLLSEKDSIVYPRCLAPELRGLEYSENVHRVPDYMGSGQEEKLARILQITAIAHDNGYTHLFAGYGFMAEDAEFIRAVEDAGIIFVGPSSSVAQRAGAKDEAKKLARSLGNSVIPGVDNISAICLLHKSKDRGALEVLAKKHSLSFQYDDSLSLPDNADALLLLGYAAQVELVTIEELQAEAGGQSATIWKKYPGKRIRFKHIGGGGGKGQRVVAQPGDVSSAVMDILAESKVVQPGSNRNFLLELNIEISRHNEIQIIGNGDWCVSLGGRDCSLQMHEQKLLELSLTQELLEAEIEASAGLAAAAVLKRDLVTLQAMEAEGERFGAAVNLDSVSTFECIVDGNDHFFMEMNTRIQVEHGVSELVYRLCFTNPDDATDCFYVDQLIEAMVLLSVHGSRLPKPTRVSRSLSGAEVRVNATNASLQPHAGGVIRYWSPPIEGEIRDDQGIGGRNPDTGAFVYYNLAGAYDSNIALLLTDGTTREDNLERISEILRSTELRGRDLETNLSVHYGLVSWILGHGAMVKPTTRFMGPYLAGVGALQTILRDVDLDLTWADLLGRQSEDSAKLALRRQQTLILRPLGALFGDPHLLAGYIGCHEGTLWSAGGKPKFLANPLEVLNALYRYLNLDASPGKPPSAEIWSHDLDVLREGLSFYSDLQKRLGTDSWTETEALLSADSAPKNFGGGAELWAACRSAHRGFTVAVDLLLMVPRISHRSEFGQIRVDDQLECHFPDRFTDAEQAATLARSLVPPPAASSDEIVAPTGGHFYSREAPHLPVLVQEGDRFEAGQPLFVIEVMKMFNKVLAPFAGTVTRVLQESDGTIIAKGQTIFKVTPDEVVQVESLEQIQKRRHRVTHGLLGQV